MGSYACMYVSMHQKEYEYFVYTRLEEEVKTKETFSVYLRFLKEYIIYRGLILVICILIQSYDYSHFVV